MATPGQAAEDHARAITEFLARKMPNPQPVCLLSGGETTVDLGAHPGKGGRNQEFALATWLELPADAQARCTVLAGGTDGEDGPTDAAGAIVDAETWREAKTQNLSGEAALAAHNAYPFLDRAGSLLRTGLTETNVMDLRVILLSK